MTYTIYAADAAREILTDLGISPEVERYVEMVARRIQAVRDEAIKCEVDRYTEVTSTLVGDRDWWRANAAEGWRGRDLLLGKVNELEAEMERLRVVASEAEEALCHAEALHGLVPPDNLRSLRNAIDALPSGSEVPK